MIEIFRILLYQPILSLLIFFYNIIPGKDLGLAIILVTIIIRLILSPLSIKALKAQKSLALLQPKLSEIKKKYSKDRVRQSQEMMRLYKDHKINPFSPFLILLIQLPILIAVFEVFRKGLKAGQLNPIGFSFLNLAQPSVVLALITGIIQYFQAKTMPTALPKAEFTKIKNGASDEKTVALVNKQMQIMMPIFTVIIGVTLPSGLILYWLVSLLFTIFEQKIIKNVK